MLTSEDEEAVEKEFEEIIQLNLPDVPEDEAKTDTIFPPVPNHEPSSEKKKDKKDERIALAA